MSRWKVFKLGKQKNLAENLLICRLFHSQLVIGLNLMSLNRRWTSATCDTWKWIFNICLSHSFRSPTVKQYFLFSLTFRKFLKIWIIKTFFSNTFIKTLFKILVKDFSLDNKIPQRQIANFVMYEDFPQWASSIKPPTSTLLSF